ncbi:MAG: UDP-N-acetylglucosamine diphosphorylase/glucosamine-1-phosphate N-acetyltransferase [Candidatus Marinamargulisbacteria bacterium]|jgi:UDP-N-acetylglucosamine diphosphorylase/glucosamine-1-phosphate N-acetyltransferase
MINICIYEDSGYENLLPLTFTRPAYDLLMGIDTIFDKINRYFSYGNLSLHCREYLKPLVKKDHPHLPINAVNTGTSCLFINGRVLFNQELYNILLELDNQHNYLFTKNGSVVAAYLRGDSLEFMRISLNSTPSSAEMIRYLRTKCITKELDQCHVVDNVWDLLTHNQDLIHTDFAYLNQPGIIKGEIKPFASIYNENNVFIDEGTVVEDFVVINANAGPVYIEKDVYIEAQSRLEGPLYIGKNSHIKGGKVTACSIGNNCKISGEISHCVVSPFTNKAHLGFLGHSYIGKWVNLGANTTTSNLKNTYTEISLESPDSDPIPTGQLFLGSIIGDHVKTAIGTVLNSGTVVGYGSNLFGSGFHNKYVPPFSWGKPGEYQVFKVNKFLEMVTNMMKRRRLELSHDEKEIISALYNNESKKHQKRK